MKQHPIFRKDKKRISRVRFISLAVFMAAVVGLSSCIQNEKQQTAVKGYLFLGSNTRVTFLPADGKGTIGLGRVIEGDFDAQGKWVDGRWLNGDEIQLRYDLLYAVKEGYSGQGLNFGRPEPSFLKVELFNY